MPLDPHHPSSVLARFDVRRDPNPTERARECIGGPDSAHSVAHLLYCGLCALSDEADAAGLDGIRDHIDDIADRLDGIVAELKMVTSAWDEAEAAPSWDEHRIGVEETIPRSMWRAA